MAAKASSNFCLVTASISLIVAWVFSIESQQVFALRVEKLVALRRFLVLLQGHHVDRAHGVELDAHFAVGSLLRDQLFAAGAAEALVGQQFFATSR